MQSIQCNGGSSTRNEWLPSNRSSRRRRPSISTMSPSAPHLTDIETTVQRTLTPSSHTSRRLPASRSRARGTRLCSAPHALAIAGVAPSTPSASSSDAAAASELLADSSCTPDGTPPLPASTAAGASASGSASNASASDAAGSDTVSSSSRCCGCCGRCRCCCWTTSASAAARVPNREYVPRPNCGSPRSAKPTLGVH